MKKITTKELVLMAMMTALIAVFAQIQIPLPFSPVPIALATFAIYISAGLLGPFKSGLSTLVYVLLGAVGVPVFAGFTGGFAIITGPTGGYIIGYIVMAIVIGVMMKIMPKNVFTTALSMVVGTVVLYAFGTAWFMISTGSELVPALVSCVIPFLLGDFIKIALSAVLVRRLEKVVKVCN